MLKDNIIKTLTFLSLFITLFLTGCIKDKKTDEFPRNVDFYIRYISEGDQFNSLCKISYADSVAIGEPDTSSYNITVGGKDMKEIVTAKGNKNYNLKMNLPYQSTYDIKIKNRDNQILSQETKLIKIDSLTVEKTISISKGGSIKFHGQPIGQEESLILMLVGKDGKTSSTTVQGPGSSNDILLKADNMSMLTAGPADLYLIRVYSAVITNEHMTFYFRNEYFSKTYKVNLIP